MVFLGYGIALIAFYYWIKCNWFVPLVMLVVLTVSLSGWGTFNWPGFFELAGFCYAPIIARFLIRALIEHVREEMAGRTFWRYVIDESEVPGRLPAEEAAYGPPAAAARSGANDRAPSAGLVSRATKASRTMFSAR